MRIVLILHDPSRSGIQRYSLSLFKALRKTTDDVGLIITPSSYLKSPSFELFKSVYGVRIYISIRLFVKSFDYLAQIYHLLNSTVAGYFGNLDKLIVTIHDLMPFALFNERAKTWGGLGWLFLFGIQRSVRTGVHNADKIICVSESTKKDLLHYIDVDPNKVRVIYYGVDHELFRPRDKLEARSRLGLPLDRPIVLNVGSEEPRKNMPVLFKSFEKLLNDVPNALLVRVGERTAQTEKLIRMFGLDGKIMYRRASPSEISLYYNAADLLVHPAYYEGFGNPPLEAMASALPVIAGNRTSIPEVVGDAGILLDPFDVDGFAYWMQEVLTNEDLRARFSEAGYRRSLGFSWEKCAKETLEVYREVLDEA